MCGQFQAARDYDKWLVEAGIVEGGGGNLGSLVQELEKRALVMSRDFIISRSHIGHRRSASWLLPAYELWLV